MTEKASMQNIIATWKQLKGEADKKAFLEQIKKEVGKPNFLNWKAIIA